MTSTRLVEQPLDDLGVNERPGRGDGVGGERGEPRSAGSDRPTRSHCRCSRATVSGASPAACGGQRLRRAAQGVVGQQDVLDRSGRARHHGHRAVRRGGHHPIAASSE